MTPKGICIGKTIPRSFILDISLAAVAKLREFYTNYSKQKTGEQTQNGTTLEGPGK